MPLTAIADFESLGKRTQCLGLADISKENKGLWFMRGGKISVRGEKLIAPALRMIMWAKKVGY